MLVGSQSSDLLCQDSLGAQSTSTDQAPPLSLKVESTFALLPSCFLGFLYTELEI